MKKWIVVAMITVMASCIMTKKGTRGGTNVGAGSDDPGHWMPGGGGSSPAAAR